MTTPIAADVWRPYEVSGVPASGAHQPDKSEIIAWGTLLETLLNGSNNGLAYATLANLNADLAHGANTTAVVYGDTTASLNGLYIKSGVSGSGSWSRIGDLPTSVVPITVTGGTANAIVATAPETPLQPAKKLFLMTPTANNTLPVTIVVNGAAPVAITSALAASLAANALINASPVIMIWCVDHYQLLLSTPVDASGVLADTQAAATAAAASASAAAATAAALSSALAGIIIQPQPQGRLTLTSGIAVTTSDVTGATNIYYTAGPHITCSGSAILADVAAEATLALDSNSGHTGYHQGGKNFDVFRINNSGTIEIGTGPTWNSGASAGSDIARGTGAGSTELQLFGNTGVLVNKNTITIRFGASSGNTVSVPATEAVYLGTFRTTADGVTEDSFLKRFLWSAYNLAPKFLKRFETTDTWTDTAANWKQANSSTSNQVEFVCGLLSAPVKAVSSVIASTTSGSDVFPSAGIGIDSTSVSSADRCTFAPISSGVNSQAPYVAEYYGYPGLGYHKLVWLVWGATGATIYGDGGDADNRVHTGISAEINC